MFRFLNTMLVILVLAAGFSIYSLEHKARSTEREIARIKEDIANRKDAIKLLRAEWASLTRPDRIQQLAEQSLGLQPVRADQIVTREELAQRVPAEPVVKLEPQGEDPIGEILKKMQR